MQVLRDGVSDGKLVALGECGLDYDRLQFCSHTQQLRGFRMQLSLARNVRLPLFLHMRAAADDFLAVLKEHRAVLDGVNPRACLQGTRTSSIDMQ